MEFAVATLESEITELLVDLFENEGNNLASRLLFGHSHSRASQVVSRIERLIHLACPEFQQWRVQATPHLSDHPSSSLLDSIARRSVSPPLPGQFASVKCTFELQRGRHHSGSRPRSPKVHHRHAHHHLTKPWSFL